VTDPVEALPGRRLPRAVREFLRTETAGGVALLAAAVVALLWANSPWKEGYSQLWGTELVLRLGRWSIAEDLRHWVNDALMALFFFVVGLEIKRELVKGDLREPRTAALPALAALGGMVVPALLYAAVNVGEPGSRGWGIPMATDIAFAIGVVALLGPRVPSSLKLFLLTLAIVDDIGAIVVIAVFYSGGLDLVALAAAAGLIAVILVLRRAGVVWLPLFALLGAGVWLATYASGVHATIAGVVLGLLTPVRSLAPAAVARDWANELADDPSPSDMATMTTMARASVSVAERLQHQLHPVTSFAVVPLFALANAGVTLTADAFEAAGSTMIIVGIILGLVVGKAVGITGATWLAVRSGLASLPEGATWGQVLGIATVAGIGFTVSLFVASLAFDPGSPAEDSAKVGILIASTAAALAGILLLRRGRQPGEAGSEA
jgi:NhaA family Na+:H+ antiporter